ncbi:MAG: hypothetical protein AAFN77_01100 [Planctomycetota bacterium]
MSRFRKLALHSVVNASSTSCVNGASEGNGAGVYSRLKISGHNGKSQLRRSKRISQVILKPVFHAQSDRPECVWRVVSPVPVLSLAIIEDARTEFTTNFHSN